MKGCLEALYYSLPNLENFNVKARVVHDAVIAPGYILFSFVYAALYVSALLAVSVLVFQKRNFK